MFFFQSVWQPASAGASVATYVNVAACLLLLKVPENFLKSKRLAFESGKGDNLENIIELLKTGKR